MSSSEESDEDLAVTASKANAFSALMDSDDEYYEEEGGEAEPPAPAPVVALPPPPAPKAARPDKKDKKMNEDEEYEFLELMRQQEAKEKPEGHARVEVKKLQFNVAKELAEKYGETSFDDCTHLPRNAHASKFIARRRKWPAVTPLPFKLTETSEGVFNVALTDYGSEALNMAEELLANQEVEEMARLLSRDQYNIWLGMAIGRMMMFGKGFGEATDTDLKLTYVLQQCLPNTVTMGAVFGGPGAKEFFRLLAFIARFAFRRGCFQTSNEIWKFAALGSSDEDPVGVLICSAIPALYAGDRDFVKQMLESGKTFRGIPLKDVPDWPVCDALLCAEEDPEKLDKEVAKWPMVFASGIDMDVPPQLGLLLTSLKRRLEPYLEQHERVIRKARQNAEKLNGEDLRKEAVEMWTGVTIDEYTYSMFVEEDALPVNPAA